MRYYQEHLRAHCADLLSKNFLTDSEVAQVLNRATVAAPLPWNEPAQVRHMAQAWEACRKATLEIIATNDPRRIVFEHEAKP